MDQALAAADLAGFPARRAEARARGRYRGLGHAVYIEQSGFPPDEFAELRFDPSGTLTILMGTQSSGQGHQTAYTQLAAERLGVDPDKVRVLQGDTAAISFGRGTGGSRSIPVGGASLVQAADKLIAKGRRIAAHLFEAAEADVEFADGVFSVAGTDRRLGIEEVARAAFDPARQAPGVEPGFDESGHFTPPQPTFPNGCHVCEVEIEPETGHIEIVRYLVVDDFGTVINPLLLAGQVQGGVAQGVGQAMLERTVFDPETGQLLTGSLTDYCIARAEDLPAIEFAYNVVPCRTNPLGVKGAGEAGAIGAPPALVNAVVDALAELGIEHLDMPLTPERVWAAIRTASRQESGMSTDRREMLDIVCRTAVAAGEAILKVYAEEFDVRHKTDKTPVTEADLAAERIIVDRLMSAFPDIPCVAEELCESEGMPPCCDRFWAIDPLDGTREFVARNGEFAVLIALVEEGRPVLGVVHGPAVGLTYAACGPGTATRRRNGGAPEPIHARAPPRTGSSSSTAARTRTAGGSPSSCRIIRCARARAAAAPSNSASSPPARPTSTRASARRWSGTPRPAKPFSKPPAAASRPSPAPPSPTANPASRTTASSPGAADPRPRINKRRRCGSNSPACIRSKPLLISSSGSLWVIRSSMLILPSMYQSTIFGTSVRPRAPPKAVPFQTRPVTSWNGRVRDLLAGAGDADDDADPPAAVAAFERLAHDVDVADALEAVIGAALGQVDEIGHEVALRPPSG